MRLHYSKVTCLLSCLFLFLESCALKELNDDAHTTLADKVEVIFDWSKAPDTQAKSMVLYIYPENRDMTDYWFNNPNGGIIRTYGGHHTVICHSNDDPYGHLLRNQHVHDDIEIYTETTALLVGQGISTTGIPRAPGTEGEPLRSTPSMLYGTQSKDIHLQVSALQQTLILYPEELVCHYSVEFVDVENIKNADVHIDATISSLAGGYYLGKMSPTAESVSHAFTLTVDEEMKSLRSDFLTFGLPPGEERPHKISVYIALKNRKGNFYTFDVSDQINKAEDPRNVNIKIYGLELPDIPDEPPTPPSQGGMSVEVDSWDTFHFNLPV